MAIESAEDILRAVRSLAPDAELEIQSQLAGSQNRHAIARFPNRPSWFVKIYPEAERFSAERLVLAELGKTYSWPILPVAGSDQGPIVWQAFPLVELTAISPSPSVMREWGALLADVHAGAVPAGLLISARAVDVVEQRLARLDEYDLPSVRPTAGLARAIWDKAALTIGREAAAHHEPFRLLMNDFGFRNTYRLPGGQLALIDFERSVVGDPHWDLGKAWDRELANPEWAAGFLSAYHESLPGAAEWPHRPTLLVTRLAAALAAIPYALRVGDQPFMHEAYEVLQRVEAELL
jgi:Phosphotransferase enzyme family